MVLLLFCQMPFHFLTNTKLPKKFRNQQKAVEFSIRSRVCYIFLASTRPPRTRFLYAFVSYFVCESREKRRKVGKARMPLSLKYAKTSLHKNPGAKPVIRPRKIYSAGVQQGWIFLPRLSEILCLFINHKHRPTTGVAKRR